VSSWCHQRSPNSRSKTASRTAALAAPWRSCGKGEVRNGLGFREETGIGSQKCESAACSSNNPGANTTTSCSTTATGSSQGSSSVCRTPATSSQTACTVFPQPTSGNHSADQANTARFTPATQKGRLRDRHPGTARVRGHEAVDINPARPAPGSHPRTYRRFTCETLRRFTCTSPASLDGVSVLRSTILDLMVLGKC
jgi:hypothetical protein